jgi:vacuolar-type H+-ATPase subunit I/STV1
MNSEGVFSGRLRALFNQEALSVMVFVGALVLLSGLVLYFYRDLKASRALAQKIKTPS